VIWIVTEMLLMEAKISRDWIAGSSISDFRFGISDWKELMG
jgi:hypothetical protein